MHTTSSSWYDIRAIGPALLIAFGLVLAFTPMASIGASGSVGNAGVQFPKCPTEVRADECPPVDCPTEPGTITIAIIAPEDCPPPVEPCPDGPNLGSAGIVAPIDCPEPEVPVTEPEVPVTEPETPTTDPEVPGDDVEGAGAEAAPTAAAPAVGRTELARTGIDRNQVLTSLVGLSFVGIGSALLVVSRRRPA